MTSTWSTIAAAACLTAILTGGQAQQQAQQPAPVPPPLTTLHAGTRLVILDATVLDHAGHIVPTPLTKEDFLIQEDKRPQLIRSFEAPEEHLPNPADPSAAKLPHTIFVLDELDSHYVNFKGSSANVIDLLGQQVYIRTELINFLRTQPARLPAPAEVLVLTHHGYQILVPDTQDRDAMIARVKTHDPGLGSPYRDALEEGTDHTSTKAALFALWSLALQQRTLPGRKDILWLGWGGPSIFITRAPDPRHPTGYERAVHQITDLLGEARITLNVMTPGEVGRYNGTANLPGQTVSYAFEQDLGFSGYVASTGGQFKHGNDVTGEIRTAEAYNSNFYTLSYRPDLNDPDGRFRRIRVTVKGHPDWTVLTSAGYYALEFGGEKDEQHQLQTDLSIATFEAMPFSAINATVSSIKRLPGSDQARITLHVDDADLQWQTPEDRPQARQAQVAVSIAALGSVFQTKPITGKVSTWTLTEPAIVEGAEYQDVTSTITVLTQVPPKTRVLRFVIQDLSNRRMGTVDLNPKFIEEAPFSDPAPAPKLQLRPAEPLAK